MDDMGGNDYVRHCSGQLRDGCTRLALKRPDQRPIQRQVQGRHGHAKHQSKSTSCRREPCVGMHVIDTVNL